METGMIEPSLIPTRENRLARSLAKAEPQYNLGNIRAFLTEGFDEHELRQICYDHSAFRSVCNRLAPSMAKAELVSRIIEYADRRMLIGKLLSIARKLNSVRYRHHRPYIRKALVVAGQSSHLIAYKVQTDGSSPITVTYLNKVSKMVQEKTVGSFYIEFETRSERDVYIFAERDNPGIGWISCLILEKGETLDVSEETGERATVSCRVWLK